MSANFFITGRIGSINEINKGVRISIASDRRVKREDGYERVTDWNTVSVFGANADYAKNHLGKGDVIEAKGRMAEGSYEKDGEKRYVTNLTVEELERLSQAESNRDDV